MKKILYSEQLLILTMNFTRIEETIEDALLYLMNYSRIMRTEDEAFIQIQNNLHLVMDSFHTEISECELFPEWYLSVKHLCKNFDMNDLVYLNDMTREQFVGYYCYMIGGSFGDKILLKCLVNDTNTHPELYQGKGKGLSKVVNASDLFRYVEQFI